MPTSKDTRRARHQQAETPTLDRGNPSASEGRVGTQQFRKVPGKGLVHLVRDETGWKEMGQSQANTNQGDKVASSVSIASGVSATSSVSSGTGIIQHSQLIGLTGTDDHTQYVHNTTARTITANHSFTGQPSFSNIDINGGDIASGTTINKSPVVTLAGDLGGNATFTNLGNATLTATIQPNSVALGTDTTGNYMSNVTGNSQVSVSHSQGEGSTASLSIANDSIGDTQLEYNTGQHLTTSSSPTFASLTTSGDILVQGDDISSDPFSSGFTGSGWKIDNAGHLEVNDATIRGTLSVFELLIQQVRATNGAIFVTSSAKVESSSGLSASDDNGTITFEDPSNNNICPFAANDLIMMQRINPGSLVANDAAGGATNVIKKLVYKVSSVSGKTITVENGGFNNTSSPSAGDDFVRIGNTSTAARQGVIYLTSDDTNSPFIDIKADIDSYSDWTGATPKVRLGKLDGITDSDLGGSLSGFGLYSNNIFLKGKIVANSGSIGGVNLASSSITVGSGGYGNANQTFYLDSSGNLSLKDKFKWNGSSLEISGDITVTNTSDFAPTNATANDTDANLKNRSNHTGTQGASSLDSTIISGGKIITGLLTADNIQTGTLTGRTVTVTHGTNVKTEVSPTRTAKTFDNGTTWYNYGNVLTYEFTSSGGMDLIAFKATFGYPGLFTVNNHYFKLDGTAIGGQMNDSYSQTILNRYTSIYPIASFVEQSSASGWTAWTPSDAHFSLTTLVTNQAASGSNIRQVRFYALSTHATPFSSGNTYKIIFLTDMYG